MAAGNIVKKHGNQMRRTVEFFLLLMGVAHLKNVLDHLFGRQYK